VLALKYRFFLTLVLPLLLAACASAPGATQPTEGFQLHTAPDGRVYRIDVRTGKTSFLEGGIFREVSEQAMQQLTVGKVYRGEDGKSTFRYAGDGKLEKWGLDRYNIPDAPSQR
jgi:hypothetical protein